MRAPDGLICQIARSASGFFRSAGMFQIDGSIYMPKEPSAGLKAHVFPTARAAMMAAYRERLQQSGPPKNSRRGRVGSVLGGMVENKGCVKDGIPTQTNLYRRRYAGA